MNPKELIERVNLGEDASHVIEAEMTVKDLMDGIEKAFKKNFPKGDYVSFFSSSFGIPSINVKCTIGPKNSWPGNIDMNDPGFHKFMIDLPGGPKAGVLYNVAGKSAQDTSILLPDKIEAKVITGGSLHVGDWPKFGWRKKSGNGPAILKHFTDYFGKMRKVVDANKDDIINDKPETAEHLFK